MPPKKEAILRLFHAGVKSARRAGQCICIHLPSAKFPELERIFSQRIVNRADRENSLARGRWSDLLRPL